MNEGSTLGRLSDKRPVCLEVYGLLIKRDTDGKLQATDVELKRFAQKVRIDPSGCWEWLGFKYNGYGMHRVNKDSKEQRAHRASWNLFVGDIPEGKVLDHICRNRACVNPGHLRAVTSQENSLAGIGIPAINSKKTHCIRGHKLEGENLLRRKGGARGCRLCQNTRTDRKTAKWKALEAVFVARIESAESILQEIHSAIGEDVDSDNASLPTVIRSIKDGLKEMNSRYESAESECLEQAKVNGMGMQREAVLRTERDRYKKALEKWGSHHLSCPGGPTVDTCRCGYIKEWESLAKKEV